MYDKKAFFCDHGRSRTLNLQSRNLTLYPIELRGLLSLQIYKVFIYLQAMKNIFYFFFAISIFLGCKKTTQNTDFKTESKINPLTYAKAISWEKDENSLKIIQNKHTQSIAKSKIPLQKIILLSSSAIGYLEGIDALSQVQGVFDADWCYSPKLHQMIANGEIEDLGKSAAPDIEKILTLKPDAVLTYTQPQQAKLFQLLENQGINVIYLDEYNETTPLGKAEYLKLYGELFGKENLADSLFTKIEKNYKALKNSVVNSSKPRVFTNTMRGDIWYMSGGESFVAQYLGDAGANYIWSNDSHLGNINLSFEEVYQKAKDADFWVNAGDFTSLQNLEKAYKNHKFFKAFQNAQVYSFTKKVNEKGANDYFETGNIRVDWVLNDLIKIFHPEKAQNHDFQFYQKLQ